MFKLRMFLIGFVILFSSSLAMSAGSELPVNGTAKTKGAGGAALATINDSSSVFINPAGLAYVKGTQIQGGFGALFNHVKYTPTGYPKETSDFDLNPLPTFGFATDMFASSKYAPVSLGFFLSPSNVLRNEYDVQRSNSYQVQPNDNNSSGVYKAVFYGLEAAPALAVKLTDNLALGFAARFGWIYLGLDNDQTNQPGDFISDEDYYGFYQSWRLGAQWHPTTEDWLNNLHVGFVFRMLSQTDLHGTFRLRYNGGPPPNETEVDTLLMDLPLQVGLGFAYDLAPEWRVMLDTFYTNTNNGNDVVFVYQQPMFGSYTSHYIRLDSKDTFKLHAGTEFDMNDWWTLRGGYTFDMRVVGDLAVNRALYDADRHVFGFGTGLEFKELPLVGDSISQVDLDLAFEFGFSERTIAVGGPYIAPGDYDQQSYNIEFLLTAHL
ncbi:OmpP1/FadL family transporter [Bdellovibrionota bacterium]